MDAVFYYDTVYTDGLSPEARFPRDRYRAVFADLQQRGIAADIRESPRCAIEDLRTAHDGAYIDAFLENRLDDRMARRIGLRPWTDRIIERTLKILGGTVAATHALFREAHRVTGNLAGGTHHAFRDAGAGYCVFNDIAVAARVAQRDHGVRRVLVIDLDVHQGDGTASIFADDTTVFTFSMHCAQNFPFRKKRSDLDIAIAAGTPDRPYLAQLEQALPTLFVPRPDLLIYQAGVDGLADDHLGRLHLTRDGLRARNSLVYAHATALRIPTLVLMGGGYARPIDRTVEALGDVFEQAVAAYALPPDAGQFDDPAVAVVGDPQP